MNEINTWFNQLDRKVFTAVSHEITCDGCSEKIFIYPQLAEGELEEWKRLHFEHRKERIDMSEKEKCGRC